MTCLINYSYVNLMGCKVQSNKAINWNNGDDVIGGRALRQFVDTLAI